KPEELAGIVREIEETIGLGKVRSFSPHLSLYKELLGANVLSVSAPGQLSDKQPTLTIITSEPDLVNHLERSALVQQLAAKIEVIVPRVAGQKTKAIRRIKDVVVSRVWLHLEKPDEGYPEIRSHLY